MRTTNTQYDMNFQKTLIGCIGAVFFSMACWSVCASPVSFDFSRGLFDGFSPFGNSPAPNTVTKDSARERGCPTITASISGSANICSGNSANLNVVISGGAGPFTVVHSGGTVANYVSNANIPVSPTANTTYSLVSVTDANGCSGSVSGSYSVKVGNLPGRFGNALAFDGTNDYVETNADITNLNNANFTIEAWVKTTSASGVGIVGLMNGNTSWEPCEKSFYIGKNGTPIYVGWGNNYIYSQKTVNDGEWHHVAVTWSYSGSGTSGTGKLYVDGIDQTSASTNHAANYPNVGTIKIGFPNYGTEAPAFFNGNIDEVRIWNTARSQAQVQSGMNIELLGNESGLVAYYDFNNGTASASNTGKTVLENRTTGSYNGTLANFSLSGGTSNWVAGNSFAIPAITGTTTFCVGDSYQLSNSVLGGAWASSNASAVSINTSGLANGLAGGSSTVSYTLVSAMGCTSSVSATVVADANTLALSSQAATASQSVCVNSPITNITYLATGNATALFSGFPTGISGNFSGNVATLSGSPSVSGTYNYTVALSTGCFRRGSLTVKNLPAKFGNALSFDGTNDYLETSSNLAPLGKGSFTIEAWVKTSGTSMGLVGVLNSNTSWEGGEKLLYVASNGTPAFVGYGDGYILSTQRINDGAWHHVAVTWNYSGSGTSGTGKLYVDGLDKTSASTSIAANYPNVGTFKIGFPNYSNEAPAFFNGSFDEVRIWNTARTLDQIQTYFNTELAGNESGLLAYYDCNLGIAGGNNSGTATATNLVASGPTATLTNFSLSGTVSNWIAGIYSDVAAIAGGLSLCNNATSQLSNATLGGVWASGNGTVGTISTAGLVTARSVGTASVSYQLTSGFGCTAASVATVTVNPDNTVALAIGSNPLNNCVNTPLANLAFSTTGATGATFSGLPSGIAGVFNAETIALSGSPTASGTFDYTVALTGGCGSVSYPGRIVVAPNNSLSLTSQGATTSQIVCANTAILDITYQASGATGAVFGGLPSGVSGSYVAGNISIKGTPSASGSFNYSVDLTGGCGTVGTTGSITANANGTWTGRSGTDWYTVANWCGLSLPTSGTDVLVPAYATNFPLVANNAVAATANNLTIQAGASLTVTGTLTIAGGIVNAGTFDAANGTIELNGAVAQSVIGSLFKDKTVSSLRINNPQGASIGPDTLYVTTALEPKSGTFTTNDRLVLRSTATKTANIGTGTGAYLSGKVVVERFLPARTARKYSLLASPVRETVRKTWQQQAYITGSGTGGTTCGQGTGNGGANDRYNSNGFDKTFLNAPSMFTYLEQAVNGSRWGSISGTGAYMEPGIGYKINIRGNRNSSTYNCANQLNASNPGAPEAVVLQSAGNVTTGNLTVALNRKSMSPFTLLGNPYPSAIDFNAFRTDNALINNNFWTYSPANNGNYSTYSNGIAVNLATGYDDASILNIASGQAFFVEANTDGNVVFKETHKSTGTMPNVRYFGNANNKLVRLRLKDAAGQSLDEVVVRFNGFGGKSFVQGWDARSIMGAGTGLFVGKGADRLAIATLAENGPNLSDTARIVMYNAGTGTYRLGFNGCEGLSGVAEIWLRDNFLDNEKLVGTDTAYDFSITADTASKSEGRFLLLFKRPAMTLPLVFMDLTATLLPEKLVRIGWTIGAPVSLKAYQVERSLDGGAFATLLEIPATDAQRYLLNDTSLPGTAITCRYRIKALSAAETTASYSPVVAVSIRPDGTTATTLNIFPNPLRPTEREIHVSGPTLSPGMYHVDVTTMEGKRIYDGSAQLGSGNFGIRLPGLPKGQYLLKLRARPNTASVYQGRFVKE